MTPPATRAPYGSKYAHVVSLGRACQPTHQIRRILEITSAHVFDWLITTDGGLVAHIDDNLAGFFDRDRLIVNPKNGSVIDAQRETCFFHDFPKGCDVDEKHAEHAGRFAFLIERWRNLLRSSDPVLFVRQHGWDDDRPAAARRLRDTIATRAPALAFDLLYLTDNPADNVTWGEAGIINRHLMQPVPYVWTGDDAAWERVLAHALALGAPTARRAGNHTGS